MKIFKCLGQVKTHSVTFSFLALHMNLNDWIFDERVSVLVNGVRDVGCLNGIVVL